MIEVAEKVLNAEFAKASPDRDIKDKQVALYANILHSRGCKGLIAFYESDSWQEDDRDMPTLMREGSAIGEEWAEGARDAGILQVLQTRLKVRGTDP